MQYFISNQCTIIENNDSYTFFNWENGQEVHILKNLVHLVSDEQISFEQNFEEKNIEYLLINHFISETYSKDVISERLLKLIDSQKENTKITLMPSGYKCNFRCKYCYESHDAKKEYEEKELNYFVNYIKSLKGNVIIDFFGGEPLINFKWVKNLIINLKEAQHLNTIRYSMSTNGYLLNKERIAFLVNAGVRTYQITVDGLEDIHNELRPLTNGKGSWSKIIENLKLFKGLTEYFKVIIRINFNSDSLNKDKLLKLLDILSFARGDIRFKFIFREIGDYSGINSSLLKFKINEENYVQSRNNEFLKNFEFINVLIDNGFFSEDIDVLTRPAGLVCYASYPQNFVVNDQGEILRCTVAVDQNYNKFGKINFSDNSSKPEIDNKKFSDWEKNLRWEEKCYKCKMLYQCLGMNCPVKNIANNKSTCPPVVNYTDEVLKLVLKQKMLIKDILSKRVKQGV